IHDLGVNNDLGIENDLGIDDPLRIENELGVGDGPVLVRRVALGLLVVGPRRDAGARDQDQNAEDEERTFDEEHGNLLLRVAALLDWKERITRMSESNAYTSSIASAAASGQEIGKRSHTET